jgi:hypothetical protein
VWRFVLVGAATLAAAAFALEEARARSSTWSTSIASESATWTEPAERAFERERGEMPGGCEGAPCEAGVAGEVELLVAALETEDEGGESSGRLPAEPREDWLPELEAVVVRRTADGIEASLSTRRRPSAMRATLERSSW